MSTYIESIKEQIAMENKVKELAQTRAVIETAKQTLAIYQEELEQLPEYQSVRDQQDFVRKMAEQEADIKEELSQMMLNNNHETKWDFGQVINTKTINVVDEGAALEWALERKICIQLDTKAIKKVAEELKPSGVEIVEGKATRIKSDLSAYE